MPDNTVRIKDFPNLVKKDNAYIVNVDERSYQVARSRKRKAKKLDDMEKRITSLESTGNHFGVTEKRIDSFESIEKHINAMEKRITTLEKIVKTLQGPK